MKPGKSPGLDGFPVEYYKKHIYILAPVLTAVYSESLSQGQLPNTFNEALISLILKKHKDPLDPGSFRPVSLINVDCKVLTKVLAMRLENILPDIIHEDQVGFVKGRSSSDNLRRLLHLMWKSRQENTPVAAFFLDAEKAFNRVEWGFLIHVLEAFGFGSGFVNWVKLIYTAPRASVLTNGQTSPFFQLSQGAKQGDPLSPLLCILFLEPLANAIRAEAGITGVKAGGKENKLFLYADDILWLSVDPDSSAPILLDTIEKFSYISGYKINWHKSEVMLVSRGCHPAAVSALRFKWISSGMKHLGIRLTADMSNIMHLNMTPLPQKIRNDLDRWKLLNLTLMGKIKTIKKVVAPKFNYISVMVPVTIPAGIFKQYNQIIRDYLWNGKKPRITMQKLYGSRGKGGLALPNVEF